MKIFSVSQIRQADSYTIEHEPIPSIDLMERAARACYHWFHDYIVRNKRIAIFCGKGNNGGDGLALARMLSLAGYPQVDVFIVEHSKNASEDFLINYERLNPLRVAVNTINNVEELNFEADVIVDAILGSGLNQPLRGLISETVSKLNQELALKVAIDIPTGLFADGNEENSSDLVFKSDFTLSFQFPKWSFLFEKFGNRVGTFEILDIGLSREYIDQEATSNYFITGEMVEFLVPERNKFDHKGSFGHAMIVAGSKGKIGAAILASKAALRSGAGLVTAYLPNCGLIPMQTANPEVMVQTDRGEKSLEAISFELNPTAIGLGPGLGTDKKTAKALLAFLAEVDNPLVIDADGINIIAKEKAWNLIPENSILTPHLGELDRILGKQYRGESVYSPAKHFAEENRVNLIVKGAHTAIYSSDGNVYFNSSGTVGMATAGSGDVLTGMITGLLAQKVDPIHAAILGVYFHGIAGEEAALQRGTAAVCAGDIIDNIDISQ